MASDPSMGYQSPDPSMGYQSPTPSGQTILEPRSLSQAGTDIANFGRVAANALGQGDIGLASWKALYHDIAGDADKSNALTTNLAAEKAKTAQASQDIGTAGTIAANIVGSAPVAGATGATTATKLAPYLPGWLASRVGAGVEGAAVAGGAAAGRGDPILQSAALGGAGGAVIGAPGVGRGTLPATKTADEYAQDATNAYTHAGTIQFGNGQVQQAVNNARNIVNQSPPRVIQDGQGASSLLNDMSNESLQYGGMSAERLNDFYKRFHSSLTGDLNPGAGQAAQSQIKNVLTNANPVSAHGPGEAQAALNAANTAYGQSEDLARLQGWQQKAAVSGGPDVASQARSWLNTGEGQRVAPPGSPQYDAINTLAGTGSKGSYIPWWAKHFIMAPVAGVGIGEGLHYLTGDENSPLTRVGEDVGMGLMLMGGQHAYSGATGAMASAAQQRAIDAARATIGTGSLYSPTRAPTPIFDALRQLYSKATPLMGPRASAPTN